ncbi:hypothetical protein LCGC14_1640310 [marine sediment metagenome]|uniref:Uncharacterized protein n=1 Tax=marine sediment metagenome TaxID=412755 RepID=A0A0F9I0G4_9ZZZZ
MMPPSKEDILEEEIARTTELMEQASKVIVKQTETIQAISETLKEIGRVLEVLNEKTKAMEHRIQYLEASNAYGGPLQ